MLDFIVNLNDALERYHNITCSNQNWGSFKRCYEYSKRLNSSYTPNDDCISAPILDRPLANTFGGVSFEPTESLRSLRWRAVGLYLLLVMAVIFIIVALSAPFFGLAYLFIANNVTVCLVSCFVVCPFSTVMAILFSGGGEVSCRLIDVKFEIKKYK